MQLPKFFYILHKELAIEFRQKFAVGGVFLFAATVVFLIYKTFNTIQAREWVLLLWTMLLFSGLQAVVKTFMQEKQETWLYYYTLFDPISLVAAKLLYNLLFLSLIFVFTVGCMSLFSGFPIRDLRLFASGAALGLTGLATIFTFVSVMASSERSASVLMSILALPLTLPVVLLMVKISSVSAGLMMDTSVYDDVALVAGIDSLLLGSTFLLFPLVWRA
jgi:heme exporter protein B